MLEAFGCLPRAGGLDDQDAELLQTIFSMRTFAEAHRERPSEGPGADLLFAIKEERMHMQRAGEIG